jgi:hypothetical protein
MAGWAKAATPKIEEVRVCYNRCHHSGERLTGGLGVLEQKHQSNHTYGSDCSAQNTIQQMGCQKSVGGDVGSKVAEGRLRIGLMCECAKEKQRSPDR